MKSKPQWAEEDISTMIRLRNSGASWEAISARLSNRTADAVRNEYHRRCREAEYRKISPAQEGVVVQETTRNRTSWTAQDDTTLLSALRQYGHCHSVTGAPWRKIGALLPNRTDSSVRNRANRLLQGFKSALHSPPPLPPPPMAAKQDSLASAASEPPRSIAAEEDDGSMAALDLTIDSKAAMDLATDPTAALDLAIDAHPIATNLDLAVNTSLCLRSLRNEWRGGSPTPSGVSSPLSSRRPSGVSSPLSSPVSVPPGGDDEDESYESLRLSEICRPSWSLSSRGEGSTSRGEGASERSSSWPARRENSSDRRRRDQPSGSLFGAERCSRDESVRDSDLGLDEVSWNLRALGLVTEKDESATTYFSLDELSAIATSLQEDSASRKKLEADSFLQPLDEPPEALPEASWDYVG